MQPCNVPLLHRSSRVTNFTELSSHRGNKNMEQLIERLSTLATRKDRFTFDLRGECQVYSGVVAAYRATQDSGQSMDLPVVITHALDHDGIIGAWKDPDDGRMYFDSCRVFTDVEHALRFAAEQGQRSVFNLNRDEEVPVVGERTNAQ